MRGCTVHWKTSVNRVSDIVTKGKDEHRTFRYLGHGLQDVENQADVRLIFDILSGEKRITEGKHLLPPDLASICNGVTNGHWSKSGDPLTG